MPPSFNERDVSDKPGPVRGRDRLTPRQIRDLTEKYRASSPACSRSIAPWPRSTRPSTTAHLTKRTYVIFTSDNGYMHGEHRIRAEKVQPYEEAIKVPLVIRGPGVPAGERISDPVANVDLAPTILDLAEVQVAEDIARPIDGRSLAPYTYGRGAPQRRGPDRVQARSAAHPERRLRSLVGRGADPPLRLHRVPPGAGRDPDQGFGLPIGSGSLTDTELYDLERDPHELISRPVRDPPTRRPRPPWPRHWQGCALAQASPAS